MTSPPDAINGEIAAGEGNSFQETRLVAAPERRREAGGRAGGIIVAFRGAGADATVSMPCAASLALSSSGAARNMSSMALLPA